MIQFSVGDKVMYPKFGVGEITGEEHRELVDGFEHYYVIKVFDRGATAYVPMRKMDELGVRPVMSRAKLVRVLDTLRDTPRQLLKDYRKRHERIQEKLATARPVPIAETVRDLTYRKQYANLTKRDEDLLIRGRKLLVDEMVVATDAEICDVQDAIDTALEVAMVSESDESERTQTVSTALTSTPETLVHKLVR